METEKNPASRRTILTSTGTMVSRLNGYDYPRALTEAVRLCEEGLSAGIELMMLTFYYDKWKDVVKKIRETGLAAPVIHCEKEVGTLLSDAGRLSQEKSGDLLPLWERILSLFRLNCTVGAAAGSSRMVLHLWGGQNSDRYLNYNVEALGTLGEIAGEFGIRILVENIPSVLADPLANWRRILAAGTLADGGFLFDTRFGQLHEQAEAILTATDILPHLEHVHISDFGGTYRDFSALRPILHPGEGTVDFPKIAALLNRCGYEKTITLESPVNVGAELDIPKLKRTLRYLKDTFTA